MGKFLRKLITYRSDNVTVYAGAHDVTTHESTQVRVVASDYHICDKFDWDYGYNVAIVKLKEPLQFNDYISPIQINMNPGNLLGKLLCILQNAWITLILISILGEWYLIIFTKRRL